jgi:predicted nucleic acid-binding protein
MPEGKRCIIDASILLDFIAGNIVDTLFSLPFEFITSDIVADEVSRSYSHDALGDIGLQIVELKEEEVLEIAELQIAHIELSPKDISVYILAREHRALLISGDGPLRTMADDQRIEYHGTLWLLDELLTRELLPKSDAIKALQAMLDKKRWLPRSECEKLIKKWESMK